MPDGERRLELTDGVGKRWLVTMISGSTYLFDLDENTVERVGGAPRAAAAPSDSLQSLRGIINLRVGERGQWWVRNATGGYTNPDEIWQWSSEVTRIERAPSRTGNPAPESAGPAGEDTKRRLQE